MHDAFIAFSVHKATPDSGCFKVLWQTSRFDVTDRQTDRENSNLKTLILRDSSVRSVWTYLTASPCYTTNINKKDRDREPEREREKWKQSMEYGNFIQ